MEKVTKDMALGEIVSSFPAAVPIIMSYGLHCVGCHVAAYETLEQGAKAHGMSDALIDEMLNKINSAIGKKKE